MGEHRSLTRSLTPERAKKECSYEQDRLKSNRSAVRNHIQGGWGGWTTGNGNKFSSSQAQLGQATCLGLASFLSISGATSTPSALYKRKNGYDPQTDGPIASQEYEYAIQGISKCWTRLYLVYSSKDQKIMGSPRRPHLRVVIDDEKSGEERIDRTESGEKWTISG